MPYMLLQSLYEDKVSGAVSESIFKRMAKKYDDEQNTLIAEVETLKTELETPQQKRT